MPQLDALTFFSQFIYLLISFVGVYIFVLNFIIPKMTSAMKARQKLNTSNMLNDDLDNSLDLIDLKHDFPSGIITNSETSYFHLFQKNWQSGSKRVSIWPVSTRALQLVQTLKLKKALSKLTVQRIT